MKKSSLYLLAFCAASLLSRPSSVHAAELLINGTFVTNTALPTQGYSSSIGRADSMASPMPSYILSGTATAGVGWTTDEADGYFELWTAGYQGTPAGIGNVLELANNVAGNDTYQTVTSTTGGGALGTLSFGYAARDSGTDKFTASVTDATSGATVFAQMLNPTNGLSAPITFTRTFALVPGDSYKVNFLDQSSNGKPLSAHIDMVSFMQVPEPSTVAAMLSAGLGLFLFRRKRTALPV